MKVGLHANMVDMRTDKIGSSLRAVFVILCERLSGDYGGTIEHFSIANEDITAYCLNLIYKELEVLKTKEKKLGGFNSELFRKKYVDDCTRLGYTINPN